MFSILFILTLISSNPIYSQETTKTDPTIAPIPIELCSKNNRPLFDNFNVSVAFKIGSYLCLMGQLWQKNKSEAIKIAVRVRYWEEPSLDVSPFPYFSAKVWNEIKGVDDKKQVKYAFSAFLDMKEVFPIQKMSEIVFMVQEINQTTAFQFDYHKIKSSIEPTFDPAYDQMIVYAYEYDESYFLNLKLLFSHFPDQLRIISIVIFHRTRKDEEFANYYALVYTEEIFEGKPFYFRHYMRGKRHEYHDYRETDNIFYRLDWFFDDNIDFCDELSRPPTAVVLARKKDIFYSLLDEYRLEVYFLEFYGLKHKTLKLVFENKSEVYRIEDDGDGQDLDNAESLLNCKPYPLSIKKEPIHCEDREDHIENVKGLNDDQLTQLLQSNSEQSPPTFYFFAIVLATILILVVMAVGVYLFLSPKNQKN